jgi:hypothetical protein
LLDADDGVFVWPDGDYPEPSWSRIFGERAPCGPKSHDLFEYRLPQDSQVGIVAAMTKRRQSAAGS